MPPPHASPEPGQRLGRYQLLQPLGEGGMAKVFIALKDQAHEVCVLKQLHLQLEEQDEAVVRFTREAHIASLLRHPNIASISDAGVESGKFCIAMEFIAGETIEAMVRTAAKQGGVLPLEITLPIIAAALDGLDYAHELEGGDGRALKLVHRDLSPRNIMLSYAGEVKLIDFGIAKGDVDEYKTAVGALMGTPYYMSPEQARAVAVDRRSDLYTLAAVLFEMLGGRRLVRGKGRAKILMAVAREKAPPIRTLNPAVPAAVETVLARALEKNPDDRYPTAGAFKAALLDAAGPLAQTPSSNLGTFIRSLFPNGPARAQQLLALGQTTDAGPAVEATRLAATDKDGGLVVPSALSMPSAADRTKTGYLDPLDPAAPPAIQPLAEVNVAEPVSTSAPPAMFQTGTIGDPYASSRSQLTGQTTAVQKFGVGVTLFLLCIVGYVAYGQLSAPVVLENTDIGVEESDPGVTAIVAPRTTPSAVATTKEVPAATKEPRRPPPPPVKAAPPPPPPRVEPPRAPPPKATGLRGRLAAVKDRKSAVQLNNRVQNIVDQLPDGAKKDRAQAALDRLSMTNEVPAMIAALDEAIDALGR